MKQDTLIKVNINDGLKAKLKIHEEAVIKGWRDPETGLYRIPSKERVDNLNTDTVLLNKETSDEIQSERPMTTEAVNNVYELPSREKAIQFLHAAAGFPTKAMWLRAIQAGNYATWPLLNIRNINKHFPESDEMQKGHMRQTKQGEYKQTIMDNGLTYQLLPPDMHQRNLAEKSMQTFKDHFVAILSGVDDSFPMHLWDRLLPQAELMVNLLRQ
ncbi:hypothetical protein ACHAW6_002434 [Cyclotella cf. meneghiniana]